MMKKKKSRDPLNFKQVALLLFCSFRILCIENQLAAGKPCSTLITLVTSQPKLPSLLCHLTMVAAEACQD